jgi:two-component system LytT family response regulator
MVRALIIDDEPLACDVLKKMLVQFPEVELLHMAYSGEEGIKSIRTLSPDLIFLDVQMPDKNGFAVLEALSEPELPFIIFVTAHDRYALKAFEIHALDYLLKPFDEMRFARCFQRALKQIENHNRQEFAQKILSILKDSPLLERRPSNFPNRLSVKTGSRIEFVEVQSIEWIEAADQYVKIYSGGKGKYQLVRMTMSELERRLDPARFFRAHRSAFVNINRVRDLIIKDHGDCLAILENGTKVKVSRFRKNQLLEALGNIACIH